MSKKKILFIHYNIDAPGGVVNVLSNLSSVMSDKYQVTILSLAPNIKPFYPMDSKVNIITINTPSHPIIKFSDMLRNNLSFVPKMYNLTDYIGHLGIYFKLKNWLNKNHQEYDTVISCWYKLSCMIANMPKIAPKTIAWEHTFYQVGGKFWNQQKEKNYPNLKAISCLVNVSKPFYEKWNSNVAVIPNIVNPDFENIVNTNAKKEIITVGRLDKSKNISDLIQAFYNSKAHENNWNLKIIGDGIEEENLKTLSKKLNLEKQVVFTGRLNTTEIIEHLKDAQIFGMTSLKEGLPVVLIEAQFTGLALIAYDCPTGPSEIINPNNGFLIPLKDLDTFSLKLKELTSNSELLKNKQKGSLATSKNFTSAKIIKHWNKII